MFFVLVSIVVCIILAVSMFRKEKKTAEKHMMKCKSIVVATYDDIWFNGFKKDDVMVTYPIMHPDNENLICVEFENGRKGWADIRHIKWLKYTA